MANIHIRDAQHLTEPKHFVSHSHDCYQILFLKKGSLQATIDGTTYLAKAPAMLFISNLELHSLRPTEEVYERYYIDISPISDAHHFEESALFTILSCRPVGFCHVLNIAAYEDRVEQLFRSLVAEHKKDQPFKAYREEILLYDLLILLYRQAPQLFSSVELKTAEIAWLIQRHIETNYKDPIRIEELAAKFHIHSSYLSHEFKKSTGYSVHQYLIFWRLSVARQLLAETDLPITGIAYAVGFNDSSNFSRLFRQRVGCTPNRYRIQNQIHHERKSEA